MSGATQFPTVDLYMLMFKGSDVVHIKVLGQHMICLNSLQASTDLLDRRGAKYSDRPRFTLFEVYVVGELVVRKSGI